MEHHLNQTELGFNQHICGTCEKQLCVHGNCRNCGDCARCDGEQKRWTGHHSRIRKGLEKPNHKVNEYEVRTIRMLWPSHSFAVLGRMYGLSKQQVHRIVRGEKWRHVR